MQVRLKKLPVKIYGVSFGNPNKEVYKYTGPMGVNGFQFCFAHFSVNGSHMCAQFTLTEKT